MRKRKRGVLWGAPDFSMYVCDGIQWHCFTGPPRHVITTYQWLRKTKGRWRPIAGATSSVYTVIGSEAVKCHVEIWDSQGRVSVTTRKTRTKRETRTKR